MSRRKTPQVRERKIFDEVRDGKRFVAKLRTDTLNIKTNRFQMYFVTVSKYEKDGYPQMSPETGRNSEKPLWSDTVCFDHNMSGGIPPSDSELLSRAVDAIEQKRRLVNMLFEL